MDKLLFLNTTHGGRWLLERGCDSCVSMKMLQTTGRSALTGHFIRWTCPSFNHCVKGKEENPEGLLFICDWLLGLSSIIHNQETFSKESMLFLSYSSSSSSPTPASAQPVVTIWLNKLQCSGVNLRSDPVALSVISILPQAAARLRLLYGSYSL